jgi:PAS domain S-box-containing protein
LSDGIGVVEKLHRLGFSIPIVMFTGDSASEVLDAVHHGAADCLVREKLSPQALEESLCAVIDRAQNVEWQAQYERCYLGLMDNANEIIYTHDLQGNYTSISKAGERLTGYTAEEILSMNFRELIAPEYYLSVSQTVSRMLADRRRTSFVAPIITKGKIRLQLEVAIHLVYREGTPIAVQGVAREVQSFPLTTNTDQQQVSRA